MKKYFAVVLYGCFVSLLASCSSQQVTRDSQTQQAIAPLSCVAVLPARIGEDEDISRVGGMTENVRKGADYANTVMRQELSGKPNVRLTSGEGSGSLAAAVTDAAASTGCEGVMVTSVYKFRQRAGSTMAADEPASTSFDMRIYDAATMHVLWAADFSETQESLFSNILTFGKAQSRGFKWITVEELMAQGIKERLGQCPYLKNE